MSAESNGLEAAASAASENGPTKAAEVSSAPKTPVSLLQELYVRRGITPKYDLVQIEGAVHEPTFKYRVTVGDLVATGCGQSKKKAKHTAAKAMLDKLRAVQSSENKASSEAVEANSNNKASLELPPDLDTELLSPYDDDGISGNPVGELQEMCMNRRMAPPLYEVGLEEGAPHERCFIIVCSVGTSLKESGSGKSKKLAKRQAAHKMLKTLKSMPVERDLDPTFALVDEDDLAQGIAKKSSAVKHGEAGRFHWDLKTSRGPHLASLQDPEQFEDNLEKGAEPLLKDISTEQDFDVTFVDVEEKSRDDKYHCLVQMSTTPVAVCYGVAESQKEAKFNAVTNALQYLRLMTK